MIKNQKSLIYAMLPVVLIIFFLGTGYFLKPTNLPKRELTKFELKIMANSVETACSLQKDAFNEELLFQNFLTQAAQPENYLWQSHDLESKFKRQAAFSNVSFDSLKMIESGKEYRQLLPDCCTLSPIGRYESNDRFVRPVRVVPTPLEKWATHISWQPAMKKENELGNWEAFTLTEEINQQTSRYWFDWWTDFCGNPITPPIEYHVG